MAKDGKGVAKNLGPAVGDDGQYIVFDTQGESCCCVNDPPDPESPHCPLAKWGNITPPSDALYPYQIDPTSNIPECATITLPVGNPFAGTYLLKANNGFSVLGQSTFDAGRSWGERRTAIADGTYTMKTDNNFDSNLGEIQNDFPVWPSFEYELQFSFSINSEGILTAGIRINNLTDYRGQNPIEVVYELSNIFNQPDTDWELEAKPALNFDGTVRDSRDEWNIVASLTTNGEQYRRGNDKHGCGCEWDHTRYIDHPQLINGSTGAVGTSWTILSTNSYNNELLFLDPPILQAPVETIFFPLEATSFGTFYGHSLDAGSKDFAIIDMEIPVGLDWLISEPQIPFTSQIDKRVPYYFANNFSWDFEFDTTAFNRFTTNTPLIQAGAAGDVGNQTPAVYVNFGGNIISFGIQEIIEQYPEFGANTGGLVKYCIAPAYAAQLHTATPPTTGAGYLLPWDKVLPNLTTGNITCTFYGLQTTNNPSLPGETPIVNNNPINLVLGLIYRVQITVNSVIIEDYYISYDVIGNESSTWEKGEFKIWVIAPVNKWALNRRTPEFFDQYSPGFDNDVKAGYAGSITNTAQTYEAPENCGRVVPKLLLTPQGTIDDELGTHDIVWHVNEDIGANGTHQAFDANGSMTPDIYLYSFIGSLPPGVSISPQGEMTGTPTTEGIYNVQGFFIDFYGFTRCSWKLRIEVKVKNPAFFYPESFVSGGTNDTEADWYMRDGDAGTISGNLRWGTEPYLASYVGDALDGASFNTSNGNWVLSPLYTQLGNSSGTVTMKVIDDTNKVDFVTYDWYRSGTPGP